MFGFTWVDGLVLLAVIVALCWLIGRLIRFFARPAARHDETREWDITVRNLSDDGPRP